MAGVFDTISLKIRRRDTPLYDRLFRAAMWLRALHFPVIRPLHAFLYAERGFRLSCWHFCTRFFYYEPLFRTRCERVGRELTLLVGMPQVLGHLTIILGDRVTLHGVSTFQGAKVFDRPTLRVGDNSHIGYMATIAVGCDVTIGDNVLVGNRVTIMSYDGHPTDPARRHLPAPPESSRPIVIRDNVWIGDNCFIMKGVTIGEGSVVAGGSVVTMSVPANSLAIGNPARCYPLMVTGVSPCAA